LTAIVSSASTVVGLVAGFILDRIKQGGKVSFTYFDSRWNLMPAADPNSNARNACGEFLKSYNQKSWMVGG
jgi:hypothetical protein